MATGDSKAYTYHLPYSVRRDICNILDADQSWRTLGGHFMALDATQLTLIGQAYLRNASPTEELLRKLDSANMKISDLCNYLQQMNHERALYTLKKYLFASHEQQQVNGAAKLEASLSTPTPSFSGIQPADELMNSAEFAYLMNNENYNSNHGEWNLMGAANGAPLAIDNAGCEQRASCQQLAGDQKQVPLAQQEARVGRQGERCHKWPLEPRGACHEAGKQALEARQVGASADGAEQRVSQLWLNRMMRQRRGVNVREVQEQLKLIMQISYEELKLASANFSDANILGNGGFSYVYRGLWKGTHVAIKRLCSEHMDQALNELIVLNKHKIDNILPLYGISVDGPEACLVTQFMSNGSLEDRLACKGGTAPLSWQQRAAIGEGVAKALYYLHTVRPDKPLVHGDVKPANVLLDGQFLPKLADFGMARQMFAGHEREHTSLSTHCTVSAVQGTFHYLPHEFLRNKKLSEAVDVYSYGIVMLEMATGKRAVLKDKSLLINLVEDEKRRMQSAPNGGGLRAAICYPLKDARLNDDHEDEHDKEEEEERHHQDSQREGAAEQQFDQWRRSPSASPSASTVGVRIWFELLLRLGVNCSQEQRKRRPNMGQVLQHFAHFKHSLADPAQDRVPLAHLLDYSLLDKTISLDKHSSSTLSTPAANTLTSLAAPHQLASLAENGAPSQQIAARPPVVGFEQAGHEQAAASSALMSVDEVHPIWTKDLNHQLEQQKQVVCDNGAVEDMIPLLTELGFESTQQAQVEK